jgi:DNA polymerase/3'-5' exonuclease PolX
MGICQLSSKLPMRRIDIRFFAKESYYTALLYFTGSGDFNKQMRRVAISMGYKLNEYALTDVKNKKKIKITSEKDVFDKLNMEYLPPSLRM